MAPRSALRRVPGQAAARGGRAGSGPSLMQLGRMCHETIKVATMHSQRAHPGLSEINQWLDSARIQHETRMTPQRRGHGSIRISDPSDTDKIAIAKGHATTRSMNQCPASSAPNSVTTPAAPNNQRCHRGNPPLHSSRKYPHTACNDGMQLLGADAICSRVTSVKIRDGSAAEAD